MGIKKVFAVVMAAAMSLSTLSTTGVISTTQTASAASFTDFNQSQIVSEMGAGWNLGNQLESALNGTPCETYWGNPTINENLIKAVKKAGFRSIRVPVSYLGKIGGGSSYTIDSSWLNRVQEVVDMCIKNDLYVIINMHGDGYNSIDGGWLLCNGSNQSAIQAKYKACWKQIANRFKSYDQHLIFESMNEEFDGTYGTPNSTYYSNINKLNQIFVDTVRQTGGNNAKRWLMLPGWNTNIEYTAGNYGFSIPTDNYRSSAIPSNEKRIMISVHYYDPWGFCGEESSSKTQWGSQANNSSKVDSYGDVNYLNSQFNLLYNKFTSKGYPVVIGEYGAIDKSAYDSKNTACRADFASKVCTYAKKYGCVPIWWDNGVTGTYGFGLFNRNNYKVTQQAIIDAIMAVYPASNSSSSSSSNTSSTSTQIFAGSTGESYSTSDASWLLKASDNAVITLKYTCGNANYANWGVLGWGASVNGNWVNGATYNAASVATNTVTTTFTVKELKNSLSISSNSNVGYLALNAYNSGRIISLSIANTSNNSSSDGIDTSKTYMIRNVNSGLYMDVAGAKAVNGTNVLQYSASKAKANNTWKFVPAGNGYYYIYSCLGDGKTFLLDVAYNSSANGANIGIYQNTYCDAQLYKLVKNSDGTYSIYTKSSGCKSVVEVVNAYTTNNANVQQFVYNGHNCQKWNLIAQ